MKSKLEKLVRQERDSIAEELAKLKARRSALKEKSRALRSLTKVLGLEPTKEREQSQSEEPVKRHISKAGRERIAEAARARWAKFHKDKQVSEMKRRAA